MKISIGYPKFSIFNNGIKKKSWLSSVLKLFIMVVFSMGITNNYTVNYYNVKKMSEKVTGVLKNQPVHLITPEIPRQSIEISEYGDNYVIIKASKFLGIKHCFYKAIEFFNSKYKKFFLKIGSEIYKDDEWIVVKFIAYGIVLD
jgi:hypothetical protein